MSNLRLRKFKWKMKKVFTLLSVVFIFMGAQRAAAQSFSFQSGDTVDVGSTGSFTAHNNVNNLTASPIKIQWKVIANTFPADWFATLGICDNKYCYSNADIGIGMQQESLDYATGYGDYHILGNLSSVSTPGPYYVRIRVNNKDVPTDTAIITFVVTKGTTGVANVKAAEQVALYPNPATTSVNVVYDAAADVKNIAIYNIIGKQMNMYRATGNSANLNVENMPAGIYFVRLINSRGDIVATRKFTKQ